MFKDIIKKIPKNSKLAIFGTNETAKNIFEVINNTRKDVDIKFFMSSEDNSMFLNKPVKCFLEWQHYKQIDTIVIASYSQRYFISSVINGYCKKNLIYIKEKHLQGFSKKKEIFSIKNVDDGKQIEIFGKEFRIKDKTKIQQIINMQTWKTLRKNMLHSNFLKLMLETCDIQSCKMKNEKFKLLQDVRKEVLKKAIEIFKRYNITYWLDYGTLLGAYRHKGFIPWDDDIDIAVKRDDYYKIFHLLKNEFKNTDYEVHIGGKNYFSLIIRIGDKKTGFVYFDIFPYDYSDFAGEITELKTNLLKSKDEFFKKNPLSDYYNGKFTLEEKLDEVYQIYVNNNVTSKHDSGKYLFRAVDTLSHTAKDYNNIHLTENIFPLTEIEFEGEKYPCPKNIVEYLKENEDGSYGDLMSFPLNSWDRDAFRYTRNEEIIELLRRKKDEFGL